MGRGEFGNYGDGMRHPLSESDPEMGASNLAKRRGKSTKPTIKYGNHSDLDDIYESNEMQGDSRGQFSLEDDLEEGRPARELPKKRRVRKGQSTNDRELYKRRQQENERLKHKKQAAENALFPPSRTRRRRRLQRRQECVRRGRNRNSFRKRSTIGWTMNHPTLNTCRHCTVSTSQRRPKKLRIPKPTTERSRRKSPRPTLRTHVQTIQLSPRGRAEVPGSPHLKLARRGGISLVQSWLRRNMLAKEATLVLPRNSHITCRSRTWPEI